MRAAVVAAAVVAAFVGVMYLRFASDSVTGPPPGAAVGGPQCVVFRNVGAAGDAQAQATCGPASPVDIAPVHSPPPAVVSLPTPQPSVPAFLSGMKIVPLELGPPLDLPRDIALILETGCWGCSGGPSGLIRVYVRPDGSIVHESLIDREKLGIPPQLNTAPDGSVYEFRSPLTGYAIKPDGSRIVASLCARGHCGRGGGHYEWSPESQIAIFSSSDGGISWSEIGRLDVGGEVLAILPDDRILLATFPEELTTKFQTFPDLSVIEPPVPIDYWHVKVLPNGELLWLSTKGIWVRSNGQPVLSVPDSEQDRIAHLITGPDGTDGMALVAGYTPGGSYTYYLVPFDGTGAIGRGEFARAGDSVIWSGGPEVLGGGVPNDSVLWGNASVPTSALAPNGQPYVSLFVPVALDLGTGTMRPIRPFFDVQVPVSRNLIAAVQRGPFARVVNTDNTCVNIRAEPLPSAGILDCAAEGVLLRDTGTAGGPAGEWLKVVTPSGAEGWASTQFLER